MSAFSGIGISTDLSEAFTAALESNSVRFIKVAIKNGMLVACKHWPSPPDYIVILETETLVPDGTISISGSFEEDLDNLQANLEENVPMYILARFDDLSSGWLAISYVPDTAQVRDKVSSRT